LDVGQIAVIGVLNGVLLGDQFVPSTGQNGCHRWFACFAAIAFAILIQQVVIGFDIFYLYQIQELLPGIVKMFTEHIFDVFAHVLQFKFEQIIDHGQAASAAGSGLGLAMACDVRVMGRDAFLYPAWTERGIGGDAGASWVMARIAGPSRALRWILNADRIGADEAFANGLADEVVETERVREASIELAARWANGATIAFGVAKRHIWSALNSTYAEHLVLEDDLSLRIRGTEDAAEGRLAFRERRKPAFRGR
jgi:hypothetical protein